MLRGERLRELREQRGLSQRDLSRICTLGDNMIYRYENNLSDPSGSHLQLIADYLQVSVDYLLGRTDELHGLVSPSDLNSVEREVVEALRRDGWLGLIKLGAERISK